MEVHQLLHSHNHPVLPGSYSYSYRAIKPRSLGIVLRTSLHPHQTGDSGLSLRVGQVCSRSPRNALHYTSYYVRGTLLTFNVRDWLRYRWSDNDWSWWNIVINRHRLWVVPTTMLHSHVFRQVQFIDTTAAQRFHDVAPRGMGIVSQPANKHLHEVVLSSRTALDVVQIGLFDIQLRAYFPPLLPHSMEGGVHTLQTILATNLGHFFVIATRFSLQLRCC